MIAQLVIDTSYLLEIYDVPTFSSSEAVEAIKARIRQHIALRSRFFVPLGCVVELANHMVDVTDVGVRKKLLDRLVRDVRTSIEQNKPWTIVATPTVDQLAGPAGGLTALLASTTGPIGLSLTDTSTIEEAKRLKAKYASFDYRVHIWTKDTTLKAHEPDRERDPFVN